MHPIGTYVEIREASSAWYGEVRGYVVGGYRIRVGGTDDRLVEVPAERVAKQPVVAARILRPFGEIFAEVVQENEISQSAKYVEIYLTTLLGVAGGSGISEIRGSFNSSVYKKQVYRDSDILSMTVGKFVDELIELRKGSGSCGASTELLDGLLSSTESSSPMQRVALSALLARLRSCVVGHWYCRVTRRPHSFLIECVGDEAYVWQSYFGQYMLAETLLKRERRPVAKVLDLLEAAMASDKNDAQQELFQHRFDWVDGTQPIIVEHYLNTQPAGAMSTKKALLRTLKVSWEKEWGGGKALARSMREVLPSEERDNSSPMFLEHPELWTPSAIDDNFADMSEAVQARLAKNERLDIGTEVGRLDLYDKVRRYRVVGHFGTDGHRLQRID